MADRRSDPRGAPGSSRDREEQAPRYDGPAEEREARLVGEDPDVVLDIPTLNVEELDLEVEDLRAHVSVRAEVANFVNINIGVDAYLDKLKLGIKGVEAQVLLKVKLEKILGTIDRAPLGHRAEPRPPRRPTARIWPGGRPDRELCRRNRGSETASTLARVHT